MELLALLLFFLLLGAASSLNLTHDSRDGLDWAPTDEGFRATRR